MKVKTRNLIEIILQAVCLVLLFMTPFFVPFTLIATEVKDLDLYSLTFTATGTVSWEEGWAQSILESTKYFAHGVPDWLNNLFAYGIVLLSIAGVVLFTIQFIAKKEKRNNPICLVPPIAELVLLIIFTLAGGHYFSEWDGFLYNEWSGDFYKEVLRPGTYYYVFLVALLTLVCISVVGYFLVKKRGIVEEDSPKVNISTIQAPLSNADELKKYKELLDLGVITQEEFDEKKKQLLE